IGDSQISETLTRCWPLRGAASMGAAVSITRLDLTASELRKAASGEKNSAAARRILALALVLDVVRWRRVDLRDELQRRFGVALHERSVGKVLAKLGYRKLSVRPRHPKADEEA